MIRLNFFFMLFTLATLRISAQNLVAFEDKNRYYGFKDATGKIVIAPKYQDAQDFSEGIAAVRYDSMYGFIDKTGKMVIPNQYSYARSPTEGLACVAYAGKWGFIDTKGNEVIPMEYDLAYPFENGYAEVTLNDKKWLLGKDGTLRSKNFIDYLKKAERGEVEAMLEVGVMFYEGHEVNQNHESARIWLKKAADAGNVSAMTNLGQIYYRGAGLIEKDHVASYQWYLKAAELNHPSAMHSVALMFYKGEGVEKDLAKARAWFQKAADAGYEKSAKALKAMDQQH